MTEPDNALLPGDEPTVFILDPDRDSCRALAATVRSLGLTWETFHAPADLLEAWSARRRGCLLMDARMPRFRGAAGLERLRRRGFCLPVVMLDRRGDLEGAVAAIKAGAIHYLRKPCPSERLATAVQEAVAWDRAHHACMELACRARRRLARLTPGEREVLGRLICGLSNQAAAEQLGVSRRTIEVRRAKLMTKMRCRSLAALVRTALAAGLGADPPASQAQGPRFAKS